jgi:uncharacterized damage-inducible protein DinB
MSSAYVAKLESYVEGGDFIAMQREMPQLLADLIANVSPERLRVAPAPGKWSVLQILAHLAEDELTSTWRYRQMIENPGVTLAGFDQDLWAKLGDYSAWTAEDALTMFRLLREANLRMLEKLTPDQWDSPGTHAERGPMSVRVLARHMAGHDRNHLDQIRKILT